jgi:hypothetical protein
VANELTNRKIIELRGGPVCSKSDHAANVCLVDPPTFVTSACGIPIEISSLASMPAATAFSTEQHFVVSNVNPDWRQTGQISVERRGQGILRIGYIQIDQTSPAAWNSVKYRSASARVQSSRLQARGQLSERIRPREVRLRTGAKGLPRRLPAE